VISPRRHSLQSSAIPAGYPSSKSNAETDGIVAGEGPHKKEAGTRESRELLILFEQVNAVYRTNHSVVAAHVLVACLLYVGLQGHANPTLIGIWAAGMALVVVAYLWVGYQFRRAAPSPEECPLWAKRRIALGFAAGIAWGFAGAALFPANDIAGQALLTMVLVGFGTGSLTSSVSYLPANYALVIPMLVPFIIRSGWSGTREGIILAVLLVIFLGFIINGGRNINRVLINALRTRFENIDLIAALTQEKTAAEEARQQAESANRQKSQFLASASHDLRQPLHALGLFAAALEEKIRYPEVRSIVRNISDSIAALETLFNELLDVSKLDAGVILPTWTSFPLQSLLNRIIADYGPAAKEKGLQLIIRPTRVILYSDPILIERILRNLVSNSIRYTVKGKILLGIRHEGNNKRIEVWDTGIGIPQDQHERVFEEFYQLTNPERDRTKGLGLGLAIVRRLTLLLGHPLSLDSAPDKGSVFRVSVPIGQMDQLSEPSVTEIANHDENLTGKHIVFIDDERAVREGMETLLAQWGCHVSTAGSLEECLRVLNASPAKPDLILADYRLREGNTGAEAIRQLQSIYGTEIPGALITGDTAPDRIQEAQASGYYLLHKPVVPRRLRVFINSVLKKDSYRKK